MTITVRGVVTVTEGAPIEGNGVAGDAAARSAASEAGQAASPTYAWAPVPPRPRKRHLGLWIGTPVAVVLVGAVAASLILIAPGTAVAGVSVGGMTAGAAAEAIQSTLARTTIELTGSEGNATLTAAELGASVDARTLADAAYAAHPMWNVGAWFSQAKDAAIVLNPTTADNALRKVVPTLYIDPHNATVAYSQAAHKYVVTPAVDGRGVDLKNLSDQLTTAFKHGAAKVAVTTSTIPVAAATSTASATQAAGSLNTMLDQVGFYVGTERTVPIDPATAASWITVSTDLDGKISFTASASAIQKTVDGLAAKVNRSPQNGTVVTDTEGKVLQTETASLDGRTLGDTSGVAAAFATQLAKGDGVYKLPVTVAPASTTKVSRNIVVSLSRQTAYLYQKGQLVHTYLISSGRPGHDTTPGHFRVYAKVLMQDMGCFPGAEYCTKNVPWVSYFDGDQALHGTYWHHNFGHVMSHGCVNMPIDVAKFVYYWAPIGTEVTVQN